AEPVDRELLRRRARRGAGPDGRLHGHREAGRPAARAADRVQVSGATLGIDLSSQPKNTALCVVEWSGEEALVLALWRGTDADGAPLRDESLIAALRGAPGRLPAPSKA